ncbi:MAG TPA: PilZ domain-containing protein [Myxococcota bacterium]|nr:PilZ domain-containing protein [Myxococcota bacterium]
MSVGFTGKLRNLGVEYRNRGELNRNFLSESPHGGLIVTVSADVQIGEMVLLRVRCIEEEIEVTIKGLVLWHRKNTATGKIAGIGFPASEIEKRERLLGTPRVWATDKERRNQRFQTTMKVTYETATDFVVDYTRNISSGGIFVKGKRPPELGSKILFRLYPPGEQEPIDLPGQVAWQRPGGGFGVRFAECAKSTRERLDRLVRTIAIGAPAPVSAPIFEEVTPI